MQKSALRFKQSFGFELQDNDEWYVMIVCMYNGIGLVYLSTIRNPQVD